MARWPGDAQERLQNAAIALFSEQGYGATTVPQIAERAGLTERTFYNHFADKREVLFMGQDAYIAGIAEAIRAAPARLSDLDAAVAAMLATTEWFDERREAGRRRQRIIDGRNELQERNAAKMNRFSTAVADAFRARGSSSVRADLVAAAAVRAFAVASGEWLADPRQRPLAHHLDAVVAELRAVSRNW